MFQSHQYCFRWIWIVAAILITGCHSNSVPTYKASGNVTYADGSPLFAGSVSFRSLDNPSHPTARGQIQTDGSFDLTTFASGDGAVLGNHQAVVVVPLQNGRAGFQQIAQPPGIEPKFSSYETSGLEFTVTDNPKQNQFKIIVTKSK